MINLIKFGTYYILKMHASIASGSILNSSVEI